MTELKIARGFALPLELVTEATAIVATRGAGKSSTSAVVVEEALPIGVQAVILDRTGVYWGLRSNAKGDGPGLAIYILGGPHGDVTLEPGAGGLIADLVVDSGHSFVLDLSDFSKSNAVRFSADFLERLYDRKARSRSTTMLVIDEAHFYAPQTPRGGFKGDSARLMGAMEDVVGLGRSRGLGVVLTTQRTQALNKAILDLIETLVVMRMLSPRAREAVRAWIQEKHEEDELGVIASLDSLPTGTAWVWSPVRAILERIAVRRIRTFDSYATPKVGETPVEPSARRSLDLTALGEQIAATAERQKENDPKELRARALSAEKRLAEAEASLKELNDWASELASADGENAVEAMVNVYMLAKRYAGYSLDLVDEVRALADRPAEQVTVEVPVLSAQHLLDLTGAVHGLQSAASPIVEALNKIIDATESQVPTTTIRPPSAPVREPQRVQPRQPPRAAAPPPPRVERGGSENGSVPRPQQKILDALGWYEALGVPVASRVQVAMIAGYSHTSGGYQNLLSKLKTAGLVDYVGAGTVTLTSEGRALATDPGLPTTNEGVQAAVMARLPNPQRKILEVLIAEWPEPLSREEIAERTDYSSTSGGFQNLLSKLKTAALIDYPDKGHAVALDVLFPMR